tara:strand:- start:614 stop:799 length:186 start_codon:yes stop_codon:yes gene_type:complete
MMSGNAFAYLDPGSGGFIIQAILGFLAAIFAYTAFFWNKMKSFFSKIFKKKDENSKNDSSK